MPLPDPIPTPPHSAMRRFWRLLRLLALFSVVIAALAVVLVMRADHGRHVHMMIATALGAGLTVLLGTALMTLLFLSSSSGHDQQASRHSDHKDDAK